MLGFGPAYTTLCQALNPNTSPPWCRLPLRGIGIRILVLPALAPHPRLFRQRAPTLPHVAFPDRRRRRTTVQPLPVDPPRLLLDQRKVPLPDTSHVGCLLERRFSKRAGIAGAIAGEESCDRYSHEKREACGDDDNDHDAVVGHAHCWFV